MRLALCLLTVRLDEVLLDHSIINRRSIPVPFTHPMARDNAVEVPVRHRLHVMLHDPDDLRQRPSLSNSDREYALLVQHRVDDTYRTASQSIMLNGLGYRRGSDMADTHTRPSSPLSEVIFWAYLWETK